MICKVCEYFFSRGGNEGYCSQSGEVLTDDHEEPDCMYLEKE